MNAGCGACFLSRELCITVMAIMMLARAPERNRRALTRTACTRSSMSVLGEDFKRFVFWYDSMRLNLRAGTHKNAPGRDGVRLHSVRADSSRESSEPPPGSASRPTR
jgi:hypothetical protein